MEEEFNYEITFKPIRISAKSPEDAEAKAQIKIGFGEIEIKAITEV